MGSGYVVAISKNRLSQEAIYRKYSGNCKSETWFNTESPAYRFTNEPLNTLLENDLNVDGPALSVTAAGDYLCLLAGKGAKDIRSVDVSMRASYWAEYKFRGFSELPYAMFRSQFADKNARWDSFPFDLAVSKRARRFMRSFRESRNRLVETAKGVTDPYLFFRQGYAASSPCSTGYMNSHTYSQFQKRAAGACTRFYPIDLCAFVREEDVPGEFFTNIYLSNVLDHLTDPVTGLRDLGTRRMHTVLNPILRTLRPDGELVVNMQWGYRARDGFESALDMFGYDIEALPEAEDACGRMFIARSRARII